MVSKVVTPNETRAGVASGSSQNETQETQININCKTKKRSKAAFIWLSISSYRRYVNLHKIVWKLSLEKKRYLQAAITPWNRNGSMSTALRPQKSMSTSRCFGWAKSDFDVLEVKTWQRKVVLLYRKISGISRFSFPFKHYVFCRIAVCKTTKRSRISAVMLLQDLPRAEVPS